MIFAYAARGVTAEELNMNRFRVHVIDDDSARGTR